jgi:hypothetical protein
VALVLDIAPSGTTAFVSSLEQPVPNNTATSHSPPHHVNSRMGACFEEMLDIHQLLVWFVWSDLRWVMSRGMPKKGDITFQIEGLAQ